MKRSLLNITYKDRKTSGLEMDKSRNQQCENIEMVLGRAHQPPKKPMDKACLHLETIRQEKTTMETSPTVERRPELGDGMLMPSPNHGTLRLANDDDEGSPVFHS